MRAIVVVVLILAAAAAGWWFLPRPRDPVPPDPLLHLPAGGVRITLKQRHDAVVDGGLRIHIGDITRGQTDLTLSREDGAVVLPARSVKPGDRIDFPFGSRVYRLAVLAFDTAVVGDDAAMLEITEGPSERDRIDALLKAIEESGLVFIRNGSDHEAKAAAAHLRRKLEAAGDRVSTAREFIDAIATKSSTSGEPYRLRLADGTVEDLAPWLERRLGK